MLLAPVCAGPWCSALGLAVREKTEMKLMKWTLLIVVVLALLASAALWSWGHFARRAMGAPSNALPPQAAQTQLDQWIAPALAQHPGATGAFLVDDNLDAFAARAHTARLAARSLDVQYYLWHDDLTGRALKDELLQAAERGVRVRMLIDDMNGVGLDKSLLAMDAHPNLEVRLFNPARNRDTTMGRALEMGLRFFSFNRRMHNKGWIADNRVALVGGRNIGDEYFDAAEVNFHDADLLMVGNGVAQTSAIFDAFWNSNAVIPISTMHRGKRVQVEDLRAERDAWRRSIDGSVYAAAVHKKLAQSGGQFAAEQFHWLNDLRVLSDPPEKAGPIDPDRAPEHWLMFDVLKSIFSAEKDIRLISPYFVPGNTGALLFSGMAVRGVEVSILTNSLAANDVPAVHAGYQRYRRPLLESGVRLWELKPGDRNAASAAAKPGDSEQTKSTIMGSSGASLHTKAFVIDQRRAFVGSFNFDPRSASLNTEMGVLFDDPALAQAVVAMFNDAKQPHTSYAVSLAPDGAMRWHDPEKNMDWTREPEAGWGKRLLAWGLSLLTIESQL